MTLPLKQKGCCIICRTPICEEVILANGKPGWKFMPNFRRADVLLSSGAEIALTFCKDCVKKVTSEMFSDLEEHVKKGWVRAIIRSRHASNPAWRQWVNEMAEGDWNEFLDAADPTEAEQKKFDKYQKLHILSIVRWRKPDKTRFASIPIKEK